MDKQESFKSRPECLLQSIWNDTLASRTDIPWFSHLRSDSSQITPLLPRTAAAGNYTPTEMQGEALSLALEDSPYTPQGQSKQCRAARHFLPSEGGLQSENSCFHPPYWKPVRRMKQNKRKPYNFRGEKALLLLYTSFMRSFICFLASPHLLGLCKYFHCEILWTLIDRRWAANELG